ncbi:WRKY DNA-binding domain-containing protein [Dunaliella salina]|uniref:WRKY DNA-binding domain-containing protein n=1 Tax=Dunaliella salina TaxID=3046 RepID=A0ABQ7H1A2_DUNSA|nr:WRKY DNA-binding domain-containing protein [Dunaliella salina]|eukprot:KAF5840631.1 WRKY DNA-binding domain-containing protein [Dunaliella salina]
MFQHSCSDLSVQPFSSPKAPGPSKLQQQHHKQHAHQSLPADPEDQAPKRASPARNTSKGAPSALPPTDAPSQSQQQSAAQHQPPEANGAEAGLLPLQSCTAATSPDDGVKGEETGSAAAAADPPAAALPPVSAEVPLVEATPQASSKGLLPQLDPQKTLHYAANHDGWQWRKYGEKIVKGSTNPRSYYKCSNQGCPAKKIVERNTEGVIFNTEYKGLHCHPAPATVKAAAKCRTTKPGKAQQAAQAPDPPCVPQESNTPTRRDSEGGNVHSGHGSDPAAAPPTIPRGTAHDGETLFGDWLLAMRQEHSASMWGAEEGDGATATPGRVINFGQRDAAQDLAVAVQNLQSPRPLIVWIADRHSFALRHCFGGASPKHSQLQLEQALEAALSPRPLTLNLIQQQQQQQHGQLHSSQQFARPSKRPQGGHQGTGQDGTLSPSHSQPFSQWLEGYVQQQQQQLQQLHQSHRA